jgi:hypothetical protein
MAGLTLGASRALTIWTTDERTSNRIWADSTIVNAQFIADGRRIAVTTDQGATTIHDTVKGELLRDKSIDTTSLESQAEDQSKAPVRSASGAWIAKATERDSQFSVTIVTAENGEEGAEIVTDAADVVFSSDGRTMATVDPAGQVELWIWPPDELIADACSRLDRNLSVDEWQKYLGATPYGLTCSEPEDKGRVNGTAPELPAIKGFNLQDSYDLIGDDLASLREV